MCHRPSSASCNESFFLRGWKETVFCVHGQNDTCFGLDSGRILQTITGVRVNGGVFSSDSSMYAALSGQVYGPFRADYHENKPDEDEVESEPDSDKSYDGCNDTSDGSSSSDDDDDSDSSDENNDLDSSDEDDDSDRSADSSSSSEEEDMYRDVHSDHNDGLSTVRIWSLDTDRLKIVTRWPADICNLEFSPDGAMLASASLTGFAVTLR